MFVLLPVAAAVVAAESHWSYSGKTGPAHWSSVQAGYGLCRTGNFQSPIDIVRAHARASALAPLAFGYARGGARVIDNGHTVEVDVAAGSILTVGNVRYSLVQFHFHRPSEETIDGTRFEMSAHFVHRDSAGHVAVVAVLIVKGSTNPLFERIRRSVSETATHRPSRMDLIDPSDLLPERRDYYAYRGSLTTPPCSEDVQWFVLKAPVTLSVEQIESFAKLYPNNARPVQPLNGRVVLMTK